MDVEWPDSSVLPSVVDRGPVSTGYRPAPAHVSRGDGALGRSEPLPLALSLPGISGPLPGRATRIMYKSTDFTGQPVAVTGAYIEPAASWAGREGPRPLAVRGRYGYSQVVGRVASAAELRSS
ncbi:hypothetical protein GCM10010172_51970 [Paractinoplanes ferrugineus]|uniref:Uncharacterized protein n=1 Tax=Paractinoplanes ferrugineus TaxID=113564 RepID=A0A919J1I2_9ACTN|nr:hypothetical protein Afe05nite_38240 [Actinoplanes ferrugineus]